MPANPKPNKSPSIAKSSAMLMGALVERARVVTVNIRDYTVDVTTEFSYKNRFDIPMMSPYCHQNQGEGINLIPEVGATCWICTPSEEGRDAFVLGFTMVDEGGSYRGGRELLNPGDIHLSTRDGNFVALRRGGVVQVGATPICQRVYIPIRNFIQDFAENYELHTPGGDLTWNVARKDEDSDGHQRCLLTVAAKEFADDPNEKTVAILKMGSHGEGNDTILSLLTRDKGGGIVQTMVEIGKAGDLAVKVKKFDLTVEGDLTALIDGTFSLKAQGPITVESLGALQATAQSISMTAGPVKLEMNGVAKLDAPQVLLGDGMFPALRASPDFLIAFATICATLIGATPGVPVVTLGPALVPPVQHISPKVKV
jgi:hypothetical protein